MFESLSPTLLLLIFGLSAVAIWFAGIKLSEAADILSTHFNLGEALGGMILLAIVTNLPEIAITVSAAIQDHLELAIGNILGGIAIQTVVLVVLDVFGLGKKDPLTYRAASLGVGFGRNNGDNRPDFGRYWQPTKHLCHLDECVTD